jgi:hypothetical protein
VAGRSAGNVAGSFDWLNAGKVREIHTRKGNRDGTRYTATTEKVAWGHGGWCIENGGKGGHGSECSVGQRVARGR